MSKEQNDYDVDPKLLEEAAKLEGLEAPEEEEQVSSEESDVEEVQSTTSEEEVPEPVLKAKKNGHLSRDEYVQKYGSDKGYKTEEEFNKFGENYHEIKDAIKGLSKKLEQRDKELEASLNYIDRVREREQRAARQELAAALKQAQEMGDTEAVRQITKEEAKLDYQDAAAAAQQATQQIQEVAASFEARNPWYKKDMEMTLRAEQIDNDIRAGKYAHLMPQPTNYEQLGNQIEFLIKQEFGDRVRAQQAQTQAPVINNTRSAINKSGTGDGEAKRMFKDLPKDLKLIFESSNRMLANNGYKVYTESDFIKKLQKDGEI